MNENAAGSLKAELAHYVGKIVVIDTKSPFLYLGTLESLGDNVVALVDVDVHDCASSHTSRDLYLLQSLELGIRRNRRQASLLMREVVSISLLEDVVVL